MSRSSVSIALVALSLAFAAAGSARADTTYLLALRGTDQRYFPPCRLPGQAPPCNVTVVLPWTGELTITTDSNADGVFSDAQVRSFSFQTNVASLTLPFLPSGSVSVIDGAIASVDFGGPYPADDGNFFFSGLHAYYDRDYDAPHLGSDVASGQLGAVPEPGAAVLMLFALAWTLKKGRAQRCARPLSSGAPFSSSRSSTAARRRRC